MRDAEDRHRALLLEVAQLAEDRRDSLARAKLLADMEDLAPGFPEAAGPTSVVPRGVVRIRPK